MHTGRRSRYRFFITFLLVRFLKICVGGPMLYPLTPLLFASMRLTEFNFLKENISIKRDQGVLVNIGQNLAISCIDIGITGIDQSSFLSPKRLCFSKDFIILFNLAGASKRVRCWAASTWSRATWRLSWSRTTKRFTISPSARPEGEETCSRRSAQTVSFETKRDWVINKTLSNKNDSKNGFCRASY